MHAKLIHLKSPTIQEVNHATKEEQLEWLMEQYGDLVMRLAFTYVKEKQIAEDISQEVFISCYKHLQNFEQRSTYKTWIYRITVNKCKDYLKSWSYRNIYYRDKLQSFFKGSSHSSESKFLVSEENEELFKKVLALPTKLRESIILYYYEGFSIDEIAELLAIKSNTVKTRLHRARATLKVTLEEEIIDEK
ncbi:sigma-70 family RNA polymerase sigma factor [Lysinibacillus endophyticus]|uniref:Sigma-70 family RNA polymerase sigma factor n=1 Tax=Ureibacillus endophyticus TaxID=1978490 RepID=A0A494Z8X3_9BACL|nr:sigma-70 family RNA polymerase sigma factor [Lysinibacillus endophyticus]RKQ19082.1 sigma-70 family RNA polymerase sigma factor [Lysinibacillus endophyticus]